MSESDEAPALQKSTQVGADPNTFPLERIDVSDAALFERDEIWGWFERLRREDPVHYCAQSAFGPYWSVTRFDDIVEVERNPEIYSSEPNIVIFDPPPGGIVQNAGFISMDGPRHTAHRKVVQPVSSPRNLKRLEPIIRKFSRDILDGLPVGETFDWVDRVSVELTTSMLATMFDFDRSQRRKLTYWSDMTASPEQLAAMGKTGADVRSAFTECLETFTRLWHERKGQSRQNLDFVTALANADSTQDLDPVTYLGTILLLIVGGNDTTRNSISGGVVALNEHPEEYEKLRGDRRVIPTMVDEIIRWQTPLAYMRRTATRDTVLRGRKIRKGDKVVLWYVSANRDGDAIERADEFIIDREESKKHLSFGWGVHFCMGSRIAELQIRVLWEEIMERFRFVEVVGEPVRVRSNFVKGFSKLPVRVHPG